MNVRVLIIALLIPLLAHAGTPTGERFIQALNGALLAEPVRHNDQCGLTIHAAVDIENGRKTADDVQVFTVTNNHATQKLCFGTIPVTAAETCNTALCGTAGKWTGQGFAATMNCTDADASQGSIVLARTQRTFVYAGTRCACVVGSGAGTTVQVERVVR